MSEPTPLSAEELASVKPIPGDEQWCYYCGFSWPGCFCARAKVTIDAKDTEIAALKLSDSNARDLIYVLNASIEKERTANGTLQSEIAVLKGALAAVILWIDGEPRDRAYRMALLRYNDSAGGGTETDVLNEMERQRQVVFRAARVLAGKEAQGGQGTH